MAKKLRVGDTIRGYRVTKVFGPGMMAISYGAEAPGGEKIFLKQYKSPSPAVVWYPQFVDYQQELSSRVRNGKAAHYAVRLIDAFEETWGGPTYFAAYEFVANGRDLDHMLEEEREIHRRTKVAPTRDPAVWARHVTWAKVFMAGIAALHESKIIHADLKPANAFLIKDPSLGSGYQLKLIDTDFSVLADRKAPWHGYQGYVGTDNYRSIEHMTRGAVPILASDIFTCGLILYELLVGVHPYWQEDQAEYAKRARAYDIKPPALLGIDAAAGEQRRGERDSPPLPLSRSSRETDSAGDSSGAQRPGSENRRGGVDRCTPSRRGRNRGRRQARAPRQRRRRPDQRSCRTGFSSWLQAASRLQIGVRTEIGKAVLRRFGADAEFWDDKQCTVERRPDGQWIVTPAPGTVNETLINGAPLTTPRALSDGDVLAAGRSAKGISKLPLTAHVG